MRVGKVALHFGVNARTVLAAAVVAFLFGCQSGGQEWNRTMPAANDSSAQNGTAILRQKHGSIQTKLNAVWVQGQPGSVLRAGDEIRTGPDSSADLDLGKSGGVVRLTSSTYVILRRLSWHIENGEIISDTILEVPEGRVVGNSGKLAEKSVLEIKTPTSTTRIR